MSSMLRDRASLMLKGKGMTARKDRTREGVASAGLSCLLYIMSLSRFVRMLYVVCVINN